MQTRTYNFYTTLSQNAAASIRIVAPGYIHMVCWAVAWDVVADNVAIIAELCMQSVLQSSTHDSPGIIDTVRGYSNLGAAGATITNFNKVCNGLYIPVGVGQNIYLNTSLAGTASIQAVMHVMER